MEVLRRNENAYQNRRSRSGFQLSANLARLVLGAVNIHIQIPGLEACELIIRKLGACGNRPTAIGAFGEGNNGRPALPWRTDVDVCHRPLDTGGLNGPT